MSSSPTQKADFLLLPMGLSGSASENGSENLPLPPSPPLSPSSSVSSSSDPLSSRAKCIAYLMLVVSNVVFAAVGPTFLILMDRAKVGPMTAAAWRNQLMFVMVAPCAFIEWYRTPPHVRAKWFVPTVPVRWPRHYVARHTIGSALGWLMNLILFIPALNFTTTVRASLIGNTHPFLLTLLYLILRKPLGKWSVFGMLLCGVGLVLSEMPAIVGQQDESKSGIDLLTGDLLCLGAAAADAVYFFLCSGARQSVPVYTFTFLTLIICTCGLTVASIAEQGFDNLFGYFYLDAMSFAYFAIFAFAIGVVGLAASNYTLGKLDSLLVSSAALCNPAVTGIISYCAGLEGVPGVYTIVGGFVVVAGLGVMSIGENRKRQVVAPVDADVVVTATPSA